MNKKEFLTKLSEKMSEVMEAKVSKKAADDTLIALADVVSAALKEGESVKIPGLGTFSVVEVPEKRGTIQMGNRKGEEYVTPAHNAPKFKIAKTLKEFVK
jgi:DNA-binding protein HU-beta